MIDSRISRSGSIFPDFLSLFFHIFSRAWHYNKSWDYYIKMNIFVLYIYMQVIEVFSTQLTTEFLTQIMGPQSVLPCLYFSQDRQVGVDLAVNDALCCPHVDAFLVNMLQH